MAPRQGLTAAALALASLVALSADSLATWGQRLYREGLGVDGKSVSAMVQGDVPATSTTLACVNCHKRSGLGDSEAWNRALPITGNALFAVDPARNPAYQRRSRPAYDAQSLMRAINDGVASDGQILDPLMPRYRLGRKDLQALEAYLRTLGVDDGRQGVDDTTIDLVTIVAEQAPAAEREAVVQVISRFAAIKNGGTRREAERAAASRRHALGERHIRGYRTWNYSVWTLTGEPNSWPQQLQRLYAERPPFAVISGAVGEDWQVVHNFCELNALPCVLPVTDLPGDVGDNHYNIYYDDGVRTQARVTAHELRNESRNARAPRVLLAVTDDRRGHAAVEAFQQTWQQQGAAGLNIQYVAAEGPPSDADWRAVLQRTRPDYLVAWLPQAQLQQLAEVANGLRDLPQRLYAAEAFTDLSQLELKQPLADRQRYVYPYALPAPGRIQFPRESVWLKSQHLDNLARIPAAKALFACHATGEALSQLSDNYSRDFLVEMLEHMLDGSDMTSLYPRTTLGTGQRQITRGAYVVVPGSGAMQGQFTASHWVPM